ncbi:MAG: DEAD/DEAH box helicase family protein [Bacteroidetes bacterium]|nr:DEAD/DEAH box helicase family protein [Bacteroidota bacterium]MCW5897083.1 DEAD/DEAH box helicase family protein [Bacteroidota bacterium]
MSPLRVSEAQTRYSLIDPQLRTAGWNLADHTQVRIEIPVAGYDASPAQGFTDYCLYASNGDVLAVVEAKRTSRDPRVGKQQVLDYVTAIGTTQSHRPFAFMANGEDVFFWDTEAGAERHVAGFFRREDLERLLFLKQNRKPINTITINDTIVNRSYQIEAIRRISEAIEKKKKRKALLVMATGTGKTRTTMALIDVFLRAHQAQRVLFLADRDALVEQALTDGFKVHLPHEARARIRTYAIDRTKRVYVSTLQTLEMCYSKFSPAEFDLIVADECHRSIYNKATDVLAYFDAIQIGLTATPAEFVDRDTFKFFDSDPAKEGGAGGRIPTFNYPFSDAVKEGYLVDFDVYSAQTKFQRKGIKGVDLSEEDKESLRKRGIDPEDVNYEGTDLEKKVTNKDTLCRQWEEFMDVCLKDSSGQLPAKSIVFAITHKHAMRLADAFNEMYPEYDGKLVQVITSKMERAPTLLDTFKKQDLPRIAISVDMLDTGVDFPEVVNLAFMKPINSQIKFWQMIGRGTRSHEACKRLDWLPNREKDKFLIVDFWENFEHFNMMPKDGETTGQIPVLVSIFNTRLTKLEVLFASDESLRGALAQSAPSTGSGASLSAGSGTGRSPRLAAAEAQSNRTSPTPELVEGVDAADTRRIITDLRALIARIPQESYSVKLAMKEVREAWQDDFWRYITAAKIEFLRMKVAPLLRFVPHVKPAKEFFVSKMERCGLALLHGRTSRQTWNRSEKMYV